MKLLDKQEVVQLKSFERKQELNEAIKLAKQVDRLRDLVGKEQSNFIKFRDETIKSIKNEIESCNAQKCSLYEEIKALEKRRKELLKPLDEEWVKVKVQKQHLDTLTSSIYNQQSSLNQKEIEINNQLKTINLKVNRVEELEKSKIKELEDIKLKSNELEKSIKKHLSDIDSFEKQKQDTLKEFLLKENDLKYKQVDLDNKDKYLTRRDEEIRIKEIEVEHRYQQLLKTERRLKK